MRHVSPRVFDGSARFAVSGARFSARSVLSYVGFDASLRGCEGIVNRDVHVFVGLVAMARATEHELLVRQVKVHMHLVQVSLLVMMVGGVQGDVAARDAIAQALERCNPFTNPFLDCL